MLRVNLNGECKGSQLFEFATVLGKADKYERKGDMLEMTFSDTEKEDEAANDIFTIGLEVERV